MNESESFLEAITRIRHEGEDKALNELEDAIAALNRARRKLWTADSATRSHELDFIDEATVFTQRAISTLKDRPRS